MNQNYYVVPNVFSGIDLDYLSDMFQWNYGALKASNAAISKVNDQNIRQMLERGCNLFESNINMVLNTLNGGGSNE